MSKLPAKSRSRSIMPVHTRRLMTKRGPKKVVVNPEVKKNIPVTPNKKIVPLRHRTPARYNNSITPNKNNPAIRVFKPKIHPVPGGEEKQKYKKTTLGEILDEEDLPVITRLMNLGEWQRILEYFKKPAITAKLKKKGNEPTYLWYMLQALTKTKFNEAYHTQQTLKSEIAEIERDLAYIEKLQKNIPGFETSHLQDIKNNIQEIKKLVEKENE